MNFDHTYSNFLFMIFTLIQLAGLMLSKHYMHHNSIFHFGLKWDYYLKNKMLLDSNYNLNFMGIVAWIGTLNWHGLTLYSWTQTSQLFMNVILVGILWIPTVYSTIGLKFNYWLSHLVPHHCPLGLSPLLVLIELISFIIRPLTLCVRLTANMVAGHLLLILFSSGNFVSSHIIVLSALLMLEIAVAFIQANIFIELILMYSQEF